MKVKFFILFLVLFGAGLAAYLFVRSGAFPVLIVDRTVVSASEFEDHLAALSQYYTTLIAEKKLSDASIVSVDQIRDELRRATLEQFIEDTLIAREISKRIGVREGDDLVQGKLGEIEGKITAPNFGEAVQNLYGLSVERFTKLALVPQARRELLVAELTKEQKEFGVWLTDARKGASVHILLRGFTWEDGVVKVVEDD